MNATQFKSALLSGAPVIDLGDEEVEFARFQFRPSLPVTIKGGRFRNVTLDQWRNVTFDGSAFALTDHPGGFITLFDAYAPENLTVRNARFTGTKRLDEENRDRLDVKAMLIREGGRNVVVERNVFEQIAGFVQFTRVNGFKFNDNDMRLIREGVQVDGGRDFEICRNRFGPFLADVFGNDRTDDHPDPVQLFTGSLTKPGDLATRNGTIAQNLVIGGTTPRERPQGIWIADDGGLHKSGRGFADITVEDNDLIGVNWNGIAVPQPVPELSIRDNRLYFMGGDDQHGDPVTTSWIKAQSGIVERNTAPLFALTGTAQGRDNVTAPELIDAAGRGRIVAAWDKERRPWYAPPDPRIAERDALRVSIPAETAIRDALTKKLAKDRARLKLLEGILS